MVILVMICDNKVIGLDEGTIFQMVIKGIANAGMKNGPKVFKKIFKWVNGKTIVSVVINPSSHWIDGIVAWCPVLKKCWYPNKPKMIGVIKFRLIDKTSNISNNDNIWTISKLIDNDPRGLVVNIIATVKFNTNKK